MQKSQVEQSPSQRVGSDGMTHRCRVLYGKHNTRCGKGCKRLNRGEQNTKSEGTPSSQHTTARARGKRLNRREKACLFQHHVTKPPWQAGWQAGGRAGRQAGSLSLPRLGDLTSHNRKAAKQALHLLALHRRVSTHSAPLSVQSSCKIQEKRQGPWVETQL